MNGVITERFVYFSQLRPAAKVNADSSIAEFYVYGTKENIPEYVVRNGNTYRIITDHLGSLRLVVDASDGSIKQRMAYNEFGIVTEDYIEPGFEPLPFGYAGGLYDRDTQLVKFGARDYDPETGRWTSKEPLGFAGSNNFYSYVNGDPVNYVDVSGLKLWYADKNAENEIKPIIEALIQKSSLANHIIYELHRRTKNYYIHINNQMRFEALHTTYTINLPLGNRKYTIYNGITVDPSVNTVNIDELIQIDNPQQSQELLSLERAVIHELGHLYLGRSDENTYCGKQTWCSKNQELKRMLIITEIENPVMRQMGEKYDRIEY